MRCTLSPPPSASSVSAPSACLFIVPPTPAAVHCGCAVRVMGAGLLWGKPRQACPCVAMLHCTFQNKFTGGAGACVAARTASPWGAVLLARHCWYIALGNAAERAPRLRPPTPPAVCRACLRTAVCTAGLKVWGPVSRPAQHADSIALGSAVGAFTLWVLPSKRHLPFHLSPPLRLHDCLQVRILSPLNRHLLSPPLTLPRCACFACCAACSPALCPPAFLLSRSRRPWRARAPH